MQTVAKWLIVLTLAGAAGAYVVHDRAQFRAAVQAAEEARQRQAAQARAAEQERRAQQYAAENAARLAAMSPWERRQERLQREQFHPWDGSHIAAEQAVQARMNNPRSYDHVGTTYVDHGEGRGITVHMRFRGTNAFGGVVLQRAVVEVDAGGRVTGVRFVQ